jgi:hypothetical protein
MRSIKPLQNLPVILELLDLANSRPSSLQFLQANAVMAAHPALLVVDSKPRTVHRDAAISKSEEPQRVYINLQTLWRSIAIHLETIYCRWIQPLQTIPRFSSNEMYTTMDAACYQMREASVLVEIWKTKSVRLSLKLDSQQQRHHLLFLLVLFLNIFGQKRQKKSDFFQISSPFRAVSSRLSEQ